MNRFLRRFTRNILIGTSTLVLVFALSQTGVTSAFKKGPQETQARSSNINTTITNKPTFNEKFSSNTSSSSRSSSNSYAASDYFYSPSNQFPLIYNQAPVYGPLNASFAYPPHFNNFTPSNNFVNYGGYGFVQSYPSYPMGNSYPLCDNGSYAYHCLPNTGSYGAQAYSYATPTYSMPSMPVQPSYYGYQPTSQFYAQTPYYWISSY